jgi:hypothetical protein
MKVVMLSALHTGRIYPRKYFLYLFLLKAESTPGSQCDRKVSVDEKIQLIYRESNSPPSSL